MSSSNIMMSASFPSSMVPFLSSTPIILAGVSLAMRHASANGILAFFTHVLIRVSIVAMDPASEEWSATMHTPSSRITSGSAVTSPSLAA